MPGTSLPTLTALGSRPGDKADGLALSPKLLDEFLDFLLRNSRALETVKTYRKKLYQLYEWLPEDISTGTANPEPRRRRPRPR